MDELIDLINPTTESLCKANISSEQWQEFKTLLKQRTQTYKEENSRMEGILLQMKVIKNDLTFLNNLSDCVTRMSNIVQKLQTKSFDENTIALSYTERVRKQSNYGYKLKICIKMYTNLNLRLSKEVKSAKWELSQSKLKLDGILTLSVEELQQLEEKARKYEKELMKFEKKHPWLKDPEFNLPNIVKETKILQTLKEEKDKLVSELSYYQGLKPDLREAYQQLCKLKEENKAFTANLLN